MRMKELAVARPRYGYRRLHVLLRREGWMVNPKRVLRLYREEGLTLRIPRKKRKYASWVRVPLPRPLGPNEQWTLDFVTDARADGRRFRVLTVLDVFSRQCLALDAATHFPAARVTLVLDRIIGQRSQPSVMTLDNVLSARGWSGAGTQLSSGGSGSRDSVRQRRTQPTQRSSASEKDPAAHSEHRVRARAGLALTALNTA